MAVFLSPVGGVAAQFFTNTGAVLTGGKLYTYAAGTTTPAATYTSAAGATFNTNPIVLDAAGRVPGSGEIWLGEGVQYKFVLKDSNDVLIGTYDNVTGINSNFVNYNALEEIQVATAGQTVFNLTNSYQPGTNTLSVFVDGVNQYDGSSYSYIETSSTRVTFTQGLHVGALVKFTTAVTLSAGVVSSNLVTYQPAGTGAVATTVQAKLRQTVSVKDFGAVGDGTTDDTAAIQAALNYVSQNTYRNALHVPAGVYKLTDALVVRNSGSSSKGGWSLVGDGFNSCLYQTGAGKNVLEIGRSLSTPGIMEGVTISNLSLLGTTGAGYGLYLNEVARSFFSNLWICSQEADVALKGCLINKWAGVNLGYAAFNENPISGVTIPTTRKYGILTIAGSANSYTTNAWSDVEIVGHSVGAMNIIEGSTNTYANLTIEGESGYGLLSSSEWDTYNGIYFESTLMVGVNWIELRNTQKNTFIGGFSNDADSVVSLVNATNITFIGCRFYTYSLDANSINCTLISSDANAINATATSAPTRINCTVATGSPYSPTNIYQPAITGKSIIDKFSAVSSSVATTSGVADTLFTLTDSATQTVSRIDVIAGIYKNNATNYTSIATVLFDGTTARIVANNGTGLTLTLSGLNVQVTQTSGGAQTVYYSYSFIGT